MKNIRHTNHQYTRQLIASPPILKAYNYRMGGVDKHDRLVGQHPIPLRSKRGYLRVFFHLLDTALVNAWILFRTTIQARGEWNQAARKRYTLAKFKESVILSLCGRYTSRKLQASHTGNQPTLPIQSLELITQHQVQPIKNLLPDFPTDKGRCLTCKTSQRTACMACKQVYCYTCGTQTPTWTIIAACYNKYPSLLNWIQVYYQQQQQQQQTSCQTMKAVTVNSTPQVMMMICDSILGSTLL